MIWWWVFYSEIVIINDHPDIEWSGQLTGEIVMICEMHIIMGMDLHLVVLWTWLPCLKLPVGTVMRWSRMHVSTLIIDRPQECTGSPLRNPRALSLNPEAPPHFIREESGKAWAEAYRSVSAPFTRQVGALKERYIQHAILCVQPLKFYRPLGKMYCIVSVCMLSDASECHKEDQVFMLGVTQVCVQLQQAPLFDKGM